MENNKHSFDVDWGVREELSPPEKRYRTRATGVEIILSILGALVGVVIVGSLFLACLFISPILAIVFLMLVLVIAVILK